MVFGGEAYGFYKSLLKTLKSKKVLPIICANAPIYPIHIEDLMNIMLMLSKFTHNTKKLYCLGEKHSIKLNFFLSLLKKEAGGALRAVPTSHHLGWASEGHHSIHCRAAFI